MLFYEADSYAPGPGFSFFFINPVASISPLPLPNPNPLFFFLEHSKLDSNSYVPGAGVFGELNNFYITLLWSHTFCHSRVQSLFSTFVYWLHKTDRICIVIMNLLIFFVFRESWTFRERIQHFGFGLVSWWMADLICCRCYDWHFYVLLFYNISNSILNRTIFWFD